VSIAEPAAAVEAAPDRYRLALLLAAWGQLRRGELLALRRRHLDTLHGTVRVEAAYVITADGTLLLDRPKSEAGTRTLTLPRPGRAGAPRRRGGLADRRGTNGARGGARAPQGEDVLEQTWPLTKEFAWQPQRGSNPCLHLERVVS